MKKINSILMFVVLSGILTVIGCSKEKDAPAPTPPATVYVCSDIRYTGENCNIQKTPAKIFITKLEITGFNQTNQGNNWDGCCDYGDARPDLVLQLFKDINSYQFSTDVILDADYNQTYTYNSALNTPFPFELEVGAEYHIDAVDYDLGGATQYIGSDYFTSYTSTNNFPSIIQIGGSNMTVKIYLYYQF